MKADSSTNPDDAPDTETGISPHHPAEGEIVEDAILLIPDTYEAEPVGAPGLDYAAVPDIDEPFDFPSDVKDELKGR